MYNQMSTQNNTQISSNTNNTTTQNQISNLNQTPTPIVSLPPSNPLNPSIHFHGKLPPIEHANNPKNNNNNNNILAPQQGGVNDK